ncbi:XRE family transcriptional regulator [Rhodoplanes sp. TEM]|uniref:XRE family transcriptional regulator n=1 Tax=Rhodoplanes tepidamans TaxID=200616 RepID=A0ABT5J3E5_RHOTP|nr:MULTISPECIES: XRE family transcriptional regulator [Rhodoplanes]MDC7784179.1 XRE family transcriptional regulator [Rhodoplanes tepidamans]MDC7983274.1 XRE family transcriptional regulator [Rhodoplanes sp. TEM]
MFLAQTGQHPPSAKPLRGFGSGVVELIDDFDRDTCRAVYTVRFEAAVYVLHAFKKIEAGQRNDEAGPRAGPPAITRRRGRRRGAIQAGDEVMTRKSTIEVHESGDNVFADLGRPDAERHFLKAQIVAEIYRMTRERKLTQAAAGALMGITQPEVSRLFKGTFREYSVDRLMTFLTAFDRDVEIVSHPRDGRVPGERGRIRFTTAGSQTG